MIKLAVVNLSAAVQDSDVARMVDALQLQLTRDFCPAWGKEQVRVIQAGPLDTLPDGAWAVTLTDQTPMQGGVLGFHSDVDVPIGEVEVGPIVAMAGGILTGPYSVAATLSHEALELLADPPASLYEPRTRNSDSIALEVCDPVQDNPYELAGCSVSDFVFPLWFDEEATVGAKLDQLGVVTSPFTLAPAGYWVVRHADGSSEQVFGARPPPAWWLASRRRAQRRLAP